MLSRAHIEEYYLPYLSIGSRGSKSKDIIMVVQAILYRLKTGCQWRLLPMRELAESAQLRWVTVYYHFRRWVADGSFRRLWIGLLRRFKHCLDLSSIQLDGSQTLVKRGGQAVGYQHRKSGNTTNILLLSDNSGIPEHYFMWRNQRLTEPLVEHFINYIKPLIDTKPLVD